jgi:hypothetical protein
MRRRPPPAHLDPLVLLRLVDADRQILEHLEPHLRETEPEGAAAMLALVARDSVDLDQTELAAAIRRAVLVLASGGDLQRELTLDDRAVTGLAADLDDPTRRAELDAALRGLRATADELPEAATALDSLLSDGDRAWRALAAALLADELTD